MDSLFERIWDVPLTSLWAEWMVKTMEPQQKLMDICGWPKEPYMTFFETSINDFLKLVGAAPRPDRQSSRDTVSLARLVESQKEKIRELTEVVSAQKALAAAQKKELAKNKKEVTELTNRFQQEQETAKKHEKSAKDHASRVIKLESELKKRERELDEARQTAASRKPAPAVQAKTESSKPAETGGQAGGKKV